MTPQLKKSKFNAVVPQRCGGGYVWFNTITHGFAHLDEAEHEDVQRGRFFDPRRSPLAARLEESGCLIPADRNEAKLLKAYYRRFVKPFQLTVELSRVCNFKCLYCYQNGTHDPSKVISREVLDECVRYATHVLTTRDVREFELNFIGGEPLAHQKEILYAWSRIRQALETRPSIRWRMTFDTNGALFTERLLSECRNTTFSVSLTPREDHDRKRPYLNGRPSYDVIVDALRRHRSHFARDGNQLIIRYNLDHENRDAMVDFLEEVAGWGIPGASFMVVNVVNYDFNAPYHNRLTEQDYFEQCGVALDTMVDLGMPVHLVPYGVITPCHVFTPYSCKVFYDGRINGCDIADQPGEGTVFELPSGKFHGRRESMNALTHKLCEGDYKICNMQVFPLRHYVDAYLRARAAGKARLFAAFEEHGQRLRDNLAALSEEAGGLEASDLVQLGSRRPPLAAASPAGPAPDLAGAEARLRKLLIHCGQTVDFYRARVDLDAARHRPFEVLASLPRIRKQTIRDDYARFLTADLLRDPGDRRTLERLLGDGSNTPNETPVKLSDGRTVVFEKTSGSTGVPFKLVKSVAERMAAGKSVWRLRRRLDRGVRPARLFPFEHAPLDFDFPHDLSDYSVDNVARCLAEIGRRGYTWLHGHPQALFWWAEIVAERPALRDLHRFRYIESNGSKLAPDERRFIEEAFGSPVVDNYNCREVWTVAYECRHRRLHVDDERVLVERVDEDGGPVDEPDRPGRVLITSLSSFLLPLVRYDLGDWVVLAGEPCPCGQTSPALEVVPGRGRSPAAEADGVLAGEVFSKVTRFLYGTFDFQYRRIRIARRRPLEFVVYAADFLGDREDFASRFREVTSALLPSRPVRLDFDFVEADHPVFRDPRDELIVADPGRRPVSAS